MCVLQDLASEPGPGGAQSAIHLCCGDRNCPCPCWHQSLAQDCTSQGGLRLLPNKGLRSTAPGARAAAQEQALEPQSLAGPRFLHQALHHEQQDQHPELSPALLWLPASLLILQSSLSRASQQNSSHKSFLRASASLARQPVRSSWSWQPNIAVSWPRNRWVQSGHGQLP